MKKRSHIKNFEICRLKSAIHTRQKIIQTSRLLLNPMYFKNHSHTQLSPPENKYSQFF